jgi:hypothetical protein
MNEGRREMVLATTMNEAMWLVVSWEVELVILPGGSIVFVWEIVIVGSALSVS